MRRAATTRCAAGRAGATVRVGAERPIRLGTAPGRVAAHQHPASASGWPSSWPTSTCAACRTIVFGTGCPGLPDRSTGSCTPCRCGPRLSATQARGHRCGRRCRRRGARRPTSRRSYGGGWLSRCGWGLAETRPRRRSRPGAAGRPARRAWRTVAGLGAALAALAAYPAACGGAVLPPFGIGLSGGCYQHWRNPASADASKARSWLQRVVREVELELLREVLRRFAAVQAALTPGAARRRLQRRAARLTSDIPRSAW